MTIAECIEKDIVDCPCGRLHHTSLKIVEISAGASEKLPEVLEKLHYDRVFWIADENTWPVLGEKAVALMRKAGIQESGVVLPKDVHADELGIGRVMMQIDPSADVLLAIGSGTINDIAKFLSSRLFISYIVLATAPSMDGFASSVAAMTTDQMKTTYEAHVPEAILADLDVLSQAPMEMIAAGAADVLGKFNALCDWKISSLINGEYYCEMIADLMREAVEKVAASAPGLQKREPAAIAGLTEALILSGVAMSFAGNSRPASGSEHHLSHFWEMRFLREGRKPLLHGIKVGVGTVLSIRMAEKLLDTPVDFAKAAEHAKNFDRAKWAELVKKGYGPAAEGVFALEKTAKKNNPAEHAKRLAVIQSRWEELKAVMRETLPSSKKVVELLRTLGGPVSPEEIGVEPALVKEAVLLAKELRNRYTILQLLWDLGLLEEFAGEPRC